MPITRRRSSTHTTMHLRKSKCIIIGGGASGLAAACCLSKRDIPYILLEKNEKLGKKLYATGNGRCNILNMQAPVFFGDREFAEKVVAKSGASAIKAFLEELGLVIVEEEAGRAYPSVKRADAVVDCLSHGVKGEVYLNTMAEALEYRAGSIRVKTNQGDFLGENVIVCAGGSAQKKLGASDSMLHVLAALGFASIPQTPALCPIETETKKIAGLSGLRLSCTARLISGERVLLASKGELLFTDSGVSGILIMQLSRQIPFYPKDTLSLSIDFSPLFGLCAEPFGRLAAEKTRHTQQVLAILKRRQENFDRNRPLLGILPDKLYQKLAVEGNPAQTAANITDFRLKIRGVRGMDFAQVSAGGIDCRAICPETMETEKKGLYVAGEILNVDGDCGGYNLLFAFAGALNAARHIAEKTGKGR